MTAAFPEWFYPGPPGGWTADMLDRLPPDAPPHVELIDGSLIMMSPQTAFHMFTLRLLERELTPPQDLCVVREMSVTLGLRQRPEPDLMIVKRSALPDLKTTSFKPEDVHLVVEVVSPESAERDRVTKPIKYSNAGIRYLWRIEQEDQHAVAYTFELEPSVKAYVPTGIHRKRLVTYAGFDVDIDLDLSQFMG
ncbi:Uma2 family endonuclease [Microbispora cellulosiformans]|uniref:Uma2 family endonuclease n=1 Tax=Microbispora cellulosiformans TaxID=2614688 RepID=A0A5J5K8H0_9ACTN|nr:Uma2 family endonuclease [Microbispora cellulosiformans]KAA9380004.1 Uma2 family endonuclease [Microbispora cellulosiformans]